jgi:ketosteroid isomerase-like protein
MSLTNAQFQDWLDRYVAAWKSYDPKQIGDLFAENAEYRYHPADDPVVGRDAIVADWLGGKDEPGTYDARYEPLAIDGENHVARGWSRYLNADGSPRDEYWNVYVVRFDDKGRATSFTEYWIRTRSFQKENIERIKAEARAEGEANVRAVPG